MTTNGKPVAIVLTRPPVSTAEVPADVGRLFDEHAAHLLRYLTRRVGAEAAEDLVADLFETILAGKARFEAHRGSERAWLFGIATNLLRHHFRSSGRERLALARQATAPHFTPHPDAVADRVDAHRMVAQLQTALGDLRPGDRDLLLLVAWAELTPREAATVLGIPAGTARSRLHRVRAALRGALPPLVNDTEGPLT